MLHTQNYQKTQSFCNKLHVDCGSYSVKVDDISSLINDFKVIDFVTVVGEDKPRLDREGTVCFFFFL